MVPDPESEKMQRFLDELDRIEEEGDFVEVDFEQYDTLERRKKMREGLRSLVVICKNKEERVR